MLLNAKVSEGTSDRDIYKKVNAKILTKLVKHELVGRTISITGTYNNDPCDNNIS